MLFKWETHVIYPGTILATFEILENAMAELEEETKSKQNSVELKMTYASSICISSFSLRHKNHVVKYFEPSPRI